MAGWFVVIASMTVNFFYAVADLLLCEADGFLYGIRNRILGREDAEFLSHRRKQE